MNGECRHVLRRLPVATFGAAAVLGGGFVWAWALRKDEPVELVGYLRCPTIVLGAAAAAFLDDVAAPLLDVMPRGRLRRRAVDAGLAVALVVSAWLATALIGFGLVERDALLPAGFPWAASLLEPGAVTAVGFVAMAASARVAGAGGGARVSIGVGVVALASLTMDRPRQWLWPVVPAGDPWRDAHLRWAVIAFAAIAALALLSRDPAHRRPEGRAPTRERAQPSAG